MLLMDTEVYKKQFTSTRNKEREKGRSNHTHTIHSQSIPEFAGEIIYMSPKSDKWTHQFDPPRSWKLELLRPNVQPGPVQTD